MPSWRTTLFRVCDAGVKFWRKSAVGKFEDPKPREEVERDYARVDNDTMRREITNGFLVHLIKTSGWNIFLN